MFVGRGRITQFHEDTFTAGKPHTIEVLTTHSHTYTHIHTVLTLVHTLKYIHPHNKSTQHLCHCFVPTLSFPHYHSPTCHLQIECDLWPEITYAGGYKNMEVTVNAAPIDMEKYEQVR